MTLIPIDYSTIKCDCLQPGCGYCDSDGSRSKWQEEQFKNLLENMKTKYVAGFLFSPDMQRVALVEKIKPEWQKGTRNAIGGKVEMGEEYLDAMRREFWEETGVKVEDWRYFCTITGEQYIVKFYMAIGDVDQVSTTTAENIVVVPVNDMGKVLGNLNWLVPMIFDLLDRANDPNKHIDERITAIEIAPKF